MSEGLMSRRDSVFLASRTIALLLILPAVIDAVMLVPLRGFAYVEVIAAPRGPQVFSPGAFHFFGFSLLLPMLTYGIRIMVGLLFWRRGPNIVRLLLPPESSAEAPSII